MNLEERLNKIANAKPQQKNEETKTNESNTSKRIYINYISTYRERIEELITVGNALIDKGFNIDRFNATLLDLGFIVDELSNEKNILGIGYCNKENYITHLLVNKNGEAFVFPKMSGYSKYKWSRDFDKFEKKFYEYVDNEI